jgi:D-arabinose 1-dehydrogenase-like Zn-dependent alcohol dehydrogenase
VHQGRCEWGGQGIFPMVPGHEIVGFVEAVGKDVSKFKKGDRAAVGVFVDSCRTCAQCTKGADQYCSKRVPSYNGRNLKDQSPTYGGYAKDVVCDEAFVLRFPDNLDMYAGAPLLCAGITVYSPMKKYGMDAKGKKIGVVGLGGLGHMAVKFGVAFGNEVTVISRSESKRKEAIEGLGATHFVNSTDSTQVKALLGSLDFIVDTASGDKDMNLYLSLLGVDGVFVTVGLPSADVSLQISAFSLISFRKAVVGSSVGSIKDIQEMLDYCALKNITSQIEKIPLEYANKAWDRVTKSDVHYRFVLDIENSLQ